jgi:hypothetical protein
MTEPSKYMVQVSCSIDTGGVWISVYSATKSASTWDLIARARSIRDVLPHQLECPLGDPSFGLRVLDDFPERIFGHHDDGMRVKVVSELALGHQDHVHKFLHL